MSLLQCLIAIVTIAGTIRLALWYSFWKKHAVKFVESGYTPPKAGRISEFFFGAACRFVTFMTVGKVRVIRSVNVPKKGRVIFAANHQIPCDFAMVRHGSGRHFRMLTAADQLGGTFGVLAAWFGVISVAFKQKSDGAAAELACTNAVAKEDGALGIFPQGALLPDNNLNKSEFRPGCIRMAVKASLLSGQDVQIVPIAIHYIRDAKQAGWTHRFLKRYRSLFLGMRNPKHWDADFKVDESQLGASERAELLERREAKWKEYRRSHATNYGGVVVVGDPISICTLPHDPLEAIEVIRLEMARLLEIAKKQ